MKYKLFIVGFLGMALLVPVASHAQSTSELQAMIQSLLRQVAELQARIAADGDGASAWCHTFNANLRVGDSGTEVAALKTALQDQGFSTNLSSIFDEVTASAVVQFQEKYQSEVLASHGLVRGTGYVGLTTRAKLNRLYGCSPGESFPVPKTWSIYLSYVQSPAQDRNILHPGERAVVYGEDLEGDEPINVRMIGKAEDRKVSTYGSGSGGTNFIVPDVDSGEYDLFLEQGGEESNKIKVKVVVVPDQATATVDYVQSPAGDRNVIYNSGERVIVYGTNLNVGKIVVRMIGKAEDQRIIPYGTGTNTTNFIAPEVDPGEYDLFLEQDGLESNKIKVTVQ